MDVMELFGSVKEVRPYARERVNHLVTVPDISTLKRKFR